MCTHRIWDALYLGSFPVVRRRVLTEFFAKFLPFLIVDAWEQVNEQFLLDKYREFISREWHWEVLKMSWWENLIREKLSA